MIDTVAEMNRLERDVWVPRDVSWREPRRVRDWEPVKVWMQLIELFSSGAQCAITATNSASRRAATRWLRPRGATLGAPDVPPLLLIVWLRAASFAVPVRTGIIRVILCAVLNSTVHCNCVFRCSHYKLEFQSYRITGSHASWAIALILFNLNDQTKILMSLCALLKQIILF